MGPREFDELDTPDSVNSSDPDNAGWTDIKPTNITPGPGSLGLVKLRAQCEAANDYPKNIAEQGYARYQINLKYGRLQEQSTRLFCSEDRATVVFHEFSKDAKDFWPIWITSLEALEVHLGLDPSRIRRDPWCRYLFISAPSSRDKLNITHEMLTLYCTYLQIMPEFLDLLMIFEKQSRPQHFHRSFFQHRTRLSDNGFKKSSRGLAVPDLGWSGRDLQLCYNLKCAERSSQGDWPWSIRDCVVDHSFDVEFVRITWVIFKGDSLIQDRIQSATTDPNTAEMSSFQTPGEAFASTLMTHLLLIEWASENWDQYCVFVEAKSYAITGGVLSNNMDLQPHIVKEPTTGITPKPERTGTGVNAISVASVIARARTRLFQSQIRTSNRGKRATSLPIHGLEADLEQPIPPVLNETVRAECYFRGQKEFAFGDLQELQYIYDKINEALFVLELDVNSFYELLQYYESVLSLTKFPQDIARDCKEGFQLFRSQIKLHANHLHNCKLRFRTLAENVSNSIKLLYGIIDFQNVQSSKILASYSRASNINMESMAVEMNDIARKTETETASMKVITLVTLAFLPATFSSTLMSTDIFQRNDSNPTSPDLYRNLTPLQIYLALTLPLTAVTLSVWIFFHYREKASTELKRLRHYAGRLT